MMDSKLVAHAVFDTGAGTVTPQRLYNCTVTRTADGDYDITMGNAQGVGGVAEDVCEMRYFVTAGEIAGIGTARLLSVIHTSNTVKRVQVRNDAGAFALALVGIAFYKMPPLPTP